MVTKKEPMIESDRMAQQEEEEEKAKEKHPNKSKRISPYFLADFIPISFRSSILQFNMEISGTNQ